METALERYDEQRKRNARNVGLMLDSSSYGVYSIRCVAEGLEPMTESMFDMVKGVMSNSIVL